MSRSFGAVAATVWAWIQGARRAWLALAGFALLGTAFAGVLTKADLDKRFAPALLVGEKNADLPVWPLFAKDPAQPEAKPALKGYVFESVDFEPVRGYAGKPINILVAIDPAGKFLDVRLIGHKEPLFVTPSGTQTLDEFAQQYTGLSVNHSIEIFGAKARTSRSDNSAVLHGVAAGTVTVKAMDRSIMESALAVARANEGAGGGSGSASASGGASGALRNPSKGMIERHSPRSWAALHDEGLVRGLRVTRAQVEARFANTRAQGNDKLAATQAEALALDAQVALVSIPQIGRNLLDEEGWGLLKANLRGANHAFMVAESGPLAKMAYESQRVQMAQPYFLRQGGRELTLRSMAYDKGLSVPDYPQDVQAYFWLVDRATPFDPTQPFEFGLRLGRRFGSFPNQIETTELTSGYTLPRAQALIDASYEAGWVGNWRARAWEIAVLCLGLIVLSVALARQRWLSATQSRLARFRVAYLLFTLGFIGWYAQGQLTIVNITSSLEALASGNNLSFLMGDPMTVILWGFVLVSLFIWGRGTFCGWLCPFGALQELISLVVQRLGYIPKKLHTALDGKLKWVKYGVLALILVTAFSAPPVSELAIEIEPFKTAISLYFVRDWPYVLWAVACLVLSTLVYRGYCRYICPLGAALAASNFLQRWNWIARRAECGTGCQSCRHRCEYQAIAPSGKVDYAECFQCLDCVAIYQDDKRCLPLILDKKTARKIIPLHPVEVV